MFGDSPSHRPFAELAPNGNLDGPSSAPLASVELAPQGNGGSGTPGGGEPYKSDQLDPRPSAQPVPEPGTILLFGSGVMAAGWISRRRKKQQLELD